ncbi:MAG: histidine kinase dimerization/phospho-acceptor domain-containing protein, partial [Candidatus Latescibacterota bacterium]
MDHTSIFSVINRRILNAIGDPIVLIDEQGTIVLSNRSAKRAYALRENRPIASLAAARERLDFQVDDVLSLIQTDGKRHSDIIHRPLKDIDGNNIPVYLDVIKVSSGERAPSQESKGADESQKTTMATKSAKATKTSLSAKPGLRLMFDESAMEAKCSGGLRLLRFRDFTAVQKNEKWRNELISMISHDIRNPLSAIRNSLSLLLTDVP